MKMCSDKAPEYDKQIYVDKEKGQVYVASESLDSRLNHFELQLMRSERRQLQREERFRKRLDSFERKVFIAIFFIVISLLTIAIIKVDVIVKILERLMI